MSDNAVMMPARIVTNRWTTFGKYLEGAERQSVSLALKKGDMDWEVEKTPNYYYNSVGELLQKKDEWTVRRSTDGADLGTVGKDYEIVQNKTQLDFFQKFIDAGLVELDTVGCLNGGRRTWALARIIGIGGDVTPGDQLRLNVLFANSHDGSMKITLGYTPIRVICQNTLKYAIQGDKKLNQMFKIKHKGGANEAITNISEIMDQMNGTFSKNLELYKKLAASGAVVEKDLEKLILKHVLKNDAEDNEEKIATRTENNLRGILDAISNSPGSDLSKGSMWNAYNGVNWWLFNNAPTRKDQANSLNSAWFGQNAKKENDLLTAFADMVVAA